MTTCRPLPPLLLCCLALTAATAADFVPPTDVPPSGIGFRGDGTGVFPNADPPVRWSDGEHVLWRVPTANWGYASPVPVGNRVLMLTEPGHRSIWPQLTCYDAATGEQVWQVEVVAPQATSEDIARLQALDERLKAAYRIMQPLDGGGHIGKDDPRWGPINKELAAYDLECHQFKKGYGLLRYVKETSDKWKDMRKALKQNGIVAETTWAEFGHARVGHVFPTPVSDGRDIFVQTRHGTVACYDIATGKLKWAEHVPLKGRKHAEIMSSPRLWQDLLLVGFVYTGGDEGIHAFDKATGRKLWQADARAKAATEGYRSRNGGSLVVLTVGDTPVVTSGGGAVIRLPDGKAFAQGVNGSCGTCAVDDANDRIFGSGSSDRGSQTWGLQLGIDGGELTVSEIFSVGESYGGLSMVYADGVLVADEIRLDPQTGRPLAFAAKAKDKRKEKLAEAKAKGDQRMINWQYGEFKKRNQDAPAGRHTTLIAGDRVYGLIDRGPNKRDRKEGKNLTYKGVAQVYDLDGKHLATNTLVVPDWDSEQEAKWQQQGFKPMFSYACQMNIADDRIYLVSNDHLYCIGKR